MNTKSVSTGVVMLLAVAVIILLASSFVDNDKKIQTRALEVAATATDTVKVIVENVEAGDDTTKLEGGIVDIYDRAKNEVMTKTFDESGRIELELGEGKYSIQQSEAPESYNLNKAFSLFEVTADEIANNELKYIYIENNKNVGAEFSELAKAEEIKAAPEFVSIKEEEQPASAPVPTQSFVSAAERQNPQTADDAGLFNMIVFASSACLGLVFFYLSKRS